ncbi:MAG: TolC family protein, partial [Acidobacteria bacterium]|nr:TolC family protein [Acidobacteriota bacterium]
MERPRHVTIATGWLLLWAAAASAQTPLSLTQAVDEAIAHNPSLAASRASSRQAHAETRVIRAEWMPRINFTEAWQRSTQPVSGFGTLLNARQFTAADFAVDRLNRPGTVDGFVRRVGISQVVFDAGHTRAAMTIARRRADVADARVAGAIAGLTFGVVQAFGRVAAADAGADAARAAVASAREDLARAEARRSAGTATDADVLAMSVHAADMQQRQLQAESDALIARAALNQLMGAPIDRAWTTALPAVTATVPALAGLVAEAQANRAEAREADLNVAIAESALRDARGTWLPTIAADAGYEWNGLTFTSRESAWTISAGLRWSVSLGGAEQG